MTTNEALQLLQQLSQLVDIFVVDIRYCSSRVISVHIVSLFNRHHSHSFPTNRLIQTQISTVSLILSQPAHIVSKGYHSVIQDMMRIDRYHKYD